MSKRMSNRAIVAVILVILSAVYTNGEISRIDSDVDESSCLCGLNRDILDRLVQIIRASEDSAKCSAQQSTNQEDKSHDSQANITLPQSESSNNVNLGDEEDDERNEPLGGSVTVGQGPSPGVQQPDVQEPNTQEPDMQQSTTQEPGSQADAKPQESDLVAQLQFLQNQIAALTGAAQKPTPQGFGMDNSFKLPKPDEHKKDPIQQIQEIQQQQQMVQQQWLQNQIDIQNQQQQQLLQHLLQQQQQQQAKPSNVQGPDVAPSKPDTGSSSIQPPSPDISQQPASKPNEIFLQGLPNTANNTVNEALQKLNQSVQVKPEEMTSALESTIPNVVSNIFTNINDLATETANNHIKPDKSPKAPSNLTSIDGNSVSVAGNSTTEITAEGEKLFNQWIEHQLSSLHLTAATANYIRKNALNLFRKIMNQYIKRIEKLGGSIEDNVRRATQMALTNTQTLTSFLLRNYLNFAGGLMKIIGEQVSRVGKQLDATGGTISTISLNPFDIVSSVIETLPNPGDYAKYFREFGKYLMGESAQTQATATSSPAKPSSVGTGVTNQQPSPPEEKKQGLFSKTMGALGKTFGNWVG